MGEAMPTVPDCLNVLFLAALERQNSSSVSGVGTMHAVCAGFSNAPALQLQTVPDSVLFAGQIAASTSVALPVCKAAPVAVFHQH